MPGPYYGRGSGDKKLQKEADHRLLRRFRARPVKKNKGDAKDLTHYPHRRVLKVDRIFLRQLRHPVENALNSLEASMPA